LLLLTEGLGESTLAQVGVGGTFAMMILLVVLRFIREERAAERRTKAVTLPCTAGTAEYWRLLGEALSNHVSTPLQDAIGRLCESQLRLSENQQRIAELLAGIVARLPGRS
jgi:hypothetical protein